MDKRDQVRNAHTYIIYYSPHNYDPYSIYHITGKTFTMTGSASMPGLTPRYLQKSTPHLYLYLT